MCDALLNAYERPMCMYSRFVQEHIAHHYNLAFLPESEEDPHVSTGIKNATNFMRVGTLMNTVVSISLQ